MGEIIYLSTDNDQDVYSTQDILLWTSKGNIINVGTLTKSNAKNTHAQLDIQTHTHTLQCTYDKYLAFKWKMWIHK